MPESLLDKARARAKAKAPKNKPESKLSVLKKKQTETKEQAKASVKPRKGPATKQKGNSKIVIIYGWDGCGKTAAAVTFPRPFVCCNEIGKIEDFVEYPPLKIPGVKEMVEQWESEVDYISTPVLTKDFTTIDQVKTYNNIIYWVNWFKEHPDDYDTFIFDVGKGVWDAAWGSVEQQKGRSLGRTEYIPITKELKKWFIPFMYWCRKHGKHLVIISHLTGDYKDIDQYNNLLIGYVPDVKKWMLELASWKIHLQTPDESGFKEKFIAYFPKAPGEEMYSLDITDKRLYDIISNKEQLETEKKIFKKLETKRSLEAKKEKK